MATTTNRARAHRRRFARAAAAALLFAASGCSLVYGIGDYRIVDEGADAADGAAVDAPEDADASPPECTTNAECTDRFTKLGPIDAGPDASPEAGPLGVLDGGVAPAMCIRGTCARLLSEDCSSVTGDFRSDDAILLATLFSTTGAQGKTNIPRQRSAALAVEEVDGTLGGGGIPPAKGSTRTRPLVVVSCDEIADFDRVTTHLIDELHVAGIVGPNLSEDTIGITKRSSAAGTLVMSSVAVASPISSLPDDDLTWRDVPSDQQRAKLMLNQINAIESDLHAARGPTLKIAIVYRDDAFGNSGFQSINADLVWNGKALSAAENVPYQRTRKYTPSSVTSQNAVASELATSFKPDVVALFGTAESITGVMVPLEQALEAAGDTFRPHYVLIDSNKVKELIDAVALTTNMPSPTGPNALRGRVRGTGITPDGASVAVFNRFNAAYTARYNENPRVSAMGTTYDAMYSLIFALAATTDEPVSGRALEHGLRKLGTGTDVEVGVDSLLPAFKHLTAGEPISPIGTFGRLKWDPNGDILGGVVEIWCVGTPGGGPPQFLSSGLTMDVSTQTISGAFTPCPAK